MKKLVTSVDKMPELKSFQTEMENLRDHFQERMTFLRKQVDMEAKRHEQTYKDIWADFEEKLKTQGLLPVEYNNNKFCLHYDKELEMLFMEDKASNSDDEGLASLLKFLLGNKDY